MKKQVTVNTVGRRKTASARAFLAPVEEGKVEAGISVNGKNCDHYFGRATLQMIIRQPLVLIGELDKYNIRVNVKGGGPSGQAGAVRHAIARALITNNPETRKALKAAGFLTRDAREVERKKFGRHKARRRPQFSKR